jgi:hypothetical protein
MRAGRAAEWSRTAAERTKTPGGWPGENGSRRGSSGRSRAKCTWRAAAAPGGGKFQKRTAVGGRPRTLGCAGGAVHYYKTEVEIPVLTPGDAVHNGPLRENICRMRAGKIHAMFRGFDHFRNFPAIYCMKKTKAWEWGGIERATFSTTCCCLSSELLNLCEYVMILFIIYYFLSFFLQFHVLLQ